AAIGDDRGRVGGQRFRPRDSVGQRQLVSRRRDNDFRLFCFVLTPGRLDDSSRYRIVLLRSADPRFFWQPRVQTSAFGYPMTWQPGAGREYVQTSPLGLAGYRPSQQMAPVSAEPDAARSEADDLRARFERAAEDLSAREHQTDRLVETGAERPISDSASTCKTCGATLVSGARFCMTCGSTVESDEPR